MNRIPQDIYFGMRMLLKHPWITLILVLNIGLGLGSNVTIFSLLDAIVLRPLPYPEPHDLVEVLRGFNGGDVPGVSATKFLVWRQSIRAFNGIAAISMAHSASSFERGDSVDYVTTLGVSGKFFGVLNSPPAIGRDFTPDDEILNSQETAILSDHIWRTVFAADPHILGKPIRLDGHIRTIVGVAHATFQSFPPADVWIPLQLAEGGHDDSNRFFVVGRLKGGMKSKYLNSELAQVAETFRDVYPNLMQQDERIVAADYQDEIIGTMRSTLWIMWGAVGLVLLIACFNVVNLLLAQLVTRSKEIAVRIALGAGSLRILQQLVTEAVLVTLTGAVVGVFLSTVILRVLPSLYPVDLVSLNPIVINFRVLLFTVALVCIAGAAIGAGTAALATRSNNMGILNAARGPTHISRAGTRVRFGLVTCEIAVSLVLLVNAALLVRSFQKATKVQPGFEVHGLYAMQTPIRLPERLAPQVSQFQEDTVQRLESLPGVEAAAAVTSLPFELGPNVRFEVPGQEEPPYPTDWRAVTTNYFKVMEIPLILGRDFGLSDMRGSPPVAIVNRKMAKTYWPNQSAIGEHIVLMPNAEQELVRDCEVVGVVEDVKERGLDKEPPFLVYVPVSQAPDKLTVMSSNLIPLSWVVRGKVDVSSLAMFTTSMPGFPGLKLGMTNIRSMEELMDSAFRDRRFNIVLLGTFAIVALLLGTLGTYGVFSFFVSERTKEIGVRMALGARMQDVIFSVLKRALQMAALGTSIGIVIALAINRVLEALLFGIGPYDLASFCSAVLCLVVVSLMASLLPARTAASIDPMIAMREE
jgi:putative ABC transport system permease protein